MKNNNDTIGTTELAKILDLHPDTVRKRAKAGKIPFLSESPYRFSFSALQTAGIINKTRTQQSPPIQMMKEQLTYVQFVIDRSGSMTALVSAMESAIAAQLNAMKAAPANVRYVTGAVPFGDTVGPFSGFSPVDSVTKYPCTADRGWTALNDAIQDALDRVDQLMLKDSEAAHLIIVITDGFDNRSKCDALYVGAHIKKLTSTDRLTLVVNCPSWSAGNFVGLGVPANNVRPWEGTVQGVQQYAKAATMGIASYTNSRGMGQTFSTNYYVNPGDKPADVMAKKLDTSLTDVTTRVNVVRVTKGDKTAVQIRKFCEKHLGSYSPGQIFYELTKKEKVQPYKQIIVQDKTTGKFYHGWDDARKLLSLPAKGGNTVNVSPGDLGEFKVFVQSTSYNRKLPPDTAVVKFT